MGLQIHRIGLSLWVTLAHEVLEQHLALSSARVAEAMAEQVDNYVRKEKLGYYPALDYFREYQLIDGELIDTTDNITWLASNLVREEIQRKLRGIFSTVSVEHIQSQSFLMIPLRPGQPNARHQLTQLYQANRLKLELEVSLIMRQAGEEGVEALTRKMVARNLAPSFEKLEITSSHLIT